MKVLATYNIKGGVGKTTAAVNLAYLAAHSGARTLVWDLDPQGAASFFFRVKPKVKGGGKALIARRGAVDRAIQGTDYEHLDLLPADFSYRNMDLVLDAAKKRKRRIDLRLRPLADRYDYVFLDCPPGISLVSENVFRAADCLLVPLMPTTLSLCSFAQLAAFLRESPRGARPKVLAFFSMVDARKNLHRDLIAATTAERDDVLGVRIPSSSDIERMGVYRAPLPAAAPHSRSATAYRDLWAAVLGRL